MATRDALKTALTELVSEGKKLVEWMADESDQGAKAVIAYNSWYTKALTVVRVLGADRLDEFQAYYRTDPKRKGVDILTYSIQDIVSGVRPSQDRFGKIAYNAQTVAAAKIQSQVLLLSSLVSRIEGAFAELEFTILADLEDRELRAASDLLKVSVRAAGALAGVVLEAHLGKVAQAHGIGSRKKAPTIADFNDLLKEAKVLDTPTWRRIQYLADVRNLCAHKKEREPTQEEVSDLIEGVAKMTKTLF